MKRASLCVFHLVVRTKVQKSAPRMELFFVLFRNQNEKLGESRHKSCYGSVLVVDLLTHPPPHYGPYMSLILCFKKTWLFIKQHNVDNFRFWWIGVRNLVWFYFVTYYLSISWCCKAMRVYLIKPVSVSKRQLVDGNVNTFLPIKARELKLCVCYLRGKSAPLTNFQPNWTTRSKVSIFCHFICSLS